MSHRSVIRRPLAALACILQLLVGGGSSVADAWLEGSSAGAAVAHVEAPGTATCPPVHSDGCAVCRQLTTLYDTVKPAEPLLVIADGSAGPDGHADRRTPARFTRAVLPRAPPLS